MGGLAVGEPAAGAWPQPAGLLGLRGWVRVLWAFLSGEKESSFWGWVSGVWGLR